MLALLGCTESKNSDTPQKETGDSSSCTSAPETLSNHITYVPGPKEEEFAPIVETEEKQSFLVTKCSAGFFTLGDTIGNLIQQYGWNETDKKYWYDGCAIPYRLVFSEEGEIIELCYAMAEFGDGENEDLCKSDTINYVYVESDNCAGYYNRNKIVGMTILSHRFKTKEGIGVGSTFNDLEVTYTGVDARLYENMDGERFTTVYVNEYPNTCFHFSDDDIEVDEDEEVTSYGYIKLNRSHFKSNARIENVVMNSRH